MILYDFWCELCKRSFEDLVSAGQETVECECGTIATRLPSAPRVGLYNNPATRAEALRKRSHEHSVKEAKADPEKLAAKFGGTARSQSKWNIRSQKGK